MGHCGTSGVTRENGIAHKDQSEVLMHHGWAAGGESNLSCAMQAERDAAAVTMEQANQFAETAVKEFLLFRGFAHTLQAFDSDLHSHEGTGVQVRASQGHFIPPGQTAAQLILSSKQNCSSSCPLRSQISI
jgi:hypothetical protein